MSDTGSLILVTIEMGNGGDVDNQSRLAMVVTFTFK